MRLLGYKIYHKPFSPYVRMIQNDDVFLEIFQFAHLALLVIKTMKTCFKLSLRKTTVQFATLYVMISVMPDALTFLALEGYLTDL